MDHGFKTKNYTTHKLKCMRKFLDIDYSNVFLLFCGVGVGVGFDPRITKQKFKQDNIMLTASA